MTRLGFPSAAASIEEGMNSKGENLCTWAGPLTCLLFFIAWAGCAHWLPPPAPGMSAAQIAGIYQGNTFGIRLGMMLIMYSGPLYAAFSASIMMQMLRMQGPSPALAYTQFGIGCVTVLFLIIPAQTFGAVAYRPERAFDITLFGNDQSWFLFDMVNSTLIMQYLMTGLSIMFDESAEPILPRWFAFFSFWCATLLIPASLITYFKQGPFSWAGILGFYLGLVIFTAWTLMASYVLLGATKKWRITH